MADIVIPKNELGMIDIKKFIYDRVSTYVPLLDKGLKKVIIRTFENVSKEERPFICINSIGGSTNSKGIREEGYMFEVYAENVEKGEILRDILIDLFNRRNFKGIRSVLDRTGPDGADSKTGLSRHIVDFDFVFMDSKF